MDKVIHIWDPVSLQHIHTFKGHKDAVSVSLFLFCRNVFCCLLHCLLFVMQCPPNIGCVENKPPKLTNLAHKCSPNLGCGQYTSILWLPSDVFKTEKVLIFVLYSSKLLKKNSRDFWNVSPFSKIQLVVYYQFCILIGWAATRLYVVAHW